ncbi:hypothetical protein BN863_34420 [Formosa agariphila KMM 3901]|uniref:Uncharacterized protein n=1 Tax=Formosa agariphila (strain DSM 15362 / KCTC 12365 / LMG 23005 / KMM 3901 / M-2Alg 35-1) TaxID=1347342 RepID=T2KSC0_FORAG|nr:hypothetical protein BN863_34420 [Formosa agariphila KMM 3901]
MGSPLGKDFNCTQSDSPLVNNEMGETLLMWSYLWDAETRSA